MGDMKDTKNIKALSNENQVKTKNVAGGSTTVTLTPPVGNPDFMGFELSEFSGVKDSAPGDGTATGSGVDNASTGQHPHYDCGSFIRRNAAGHGRRQHQPPVTWTLVYETKSGRPSLARSFTGSRTPEPTQSRSQSHTASIVFIIHPHAAAPP